MAESKQTSFYLDTELVAVLRARADAANESLSSYVSAILQSSIDGSAKAKSADKKEATVSKEFVFKTLRDGLKKSKKVSPMCSELVAVLSSILKDEPEPPAELPVPALPADFHDRKDPELDTWLEERAQRKKAQDIADANPSAGLQPIGGGTLDKVFALAAKHGDKTAEELKAMHERSKQPRECNDVSEPRDPVYRQNEAEPTDDDWFPDDDEPVQ